MFICVSVLSLPPSFWCVYYLSLYPISLSLSLVSSDNVIPHWRDDVMPYPQVITLPISRFCYKFAVHFVYFVFLEHSVCIPDLSTIIYTTPNTAFVLNTVQGVFIHLYMALFCDNLAYFNVCRVPLVCVCVCVCVFVFYTAYVSICVLRLHSCVADLDEHVGVCTCMFICVSVLSLPPSFPLCVYYPCSLSS